MTEPRKVMWSRLQPAMVLAWCVCLKESVTTLTVFRTKPPLDTPTRVPHNVVALVPVPTAVSRLAIVPQVLRIPSSCLLTIFLRAHRNRLTRQWQLPSPSGWPNKLFKATLMSVLIPKPRRVSDTAARHTGAHLLSVPFTTPQCLQEQPLPSSKQPY